MIVFEVTLINISPKRTAVITRRSSSTRPILGNVLPTLVEVLADEPVMRATTLVTVTGAMTILVLRVTVTTKVDATTSTFPS